MNKNNSDDDNLINALKPLIEQRQLMVNQVEKIYREQINNIINSKLQDKQEIEELLDNMLDFCFDDEVLILYKRICRYYYFIDPKVTVEYINIYRELWEEET